MRRKNEKTENVNCLYYLLHHAVTTKYFCSDETAAYSVIDKKANKFVVNPPKAEDCYSTVNAPEPSYDVFVRNATVSPGNVEGTYNTLQHPAAMDEQTYNTIQHNQHESANDEDTYDKFSER